MFLFVCLFFLEGKFKPPRFNLEQAYKNEKISKIYKSIPETNILTFLYMYVEG